MSIVWCVVPALVCLCVNTGQCAGKGGRADSGSDGSGIHWSPVLDTGNEITRTLDGRTVERYTHASDPKWGYENAKDNSFYVVSPKTPREHAPLCVILHSANRTALDYLGYTCLNRKVSEWDNPSDVVTRVPDDFYGLFLNSSNEEWWGWSSVRDGGAKYADGLTPAERRVLDSIEWVSKHHNVDRNRVYLCGVSMGGCGTLGIGMPHGDVFASVCVWVPAGMEYFASRMGLSPTSSGAQPGQSIWKRNGLPDPPVVVNVFGQDDIWSQTQNTLIDAAASERFAMVAGWAPFGHSAFRSTISAYPQCSAAHNFPWLEIRRNEAYPVFTNASSNQRPPRYTAPEDKSFDTAGQINAYFRWKSDTDTPGLFSMRLWTEYPPETNGAPGFISARADVTLRRLQGFRVQTGKRYTWEIMRARRIAATGEVTSDSHGLITLPHLEIGPTPITLRVRPSARD